jgi:hypothetical protein
VLLPTCVCTLLLPVPERIDEPTLLGIERLTALKDLELSDCDLQPACLLPMTTGLTRLRLADVNLQPRQDEFAEPEQVQQQSALNASQLLQLLARLTALQELALRNVDCDWPQQLSLLSALTASSKLERLALHVGIKAAAWAHIFPAGRTLPRLRFLAAFGDVTGEPFGPVTPTDIMCLSSCCPGLQELSLNAPAAASLALLQPLTALTELGVYRIEPAAVASLAGLTQLQHLTLSACAPAAAAAAAAAAEQDAALDLHHLVPLTALRRLTRLDATRPHGAHFAALGLDLLNKVSAAAHTQLSWVRRAGHARCAGMLSRAQICAVQVAFCGQLQASLESDCLIRLLLSYPGHELIAALSCLPALLSLSALSGSCRLAS